MAGKKRKIDWTPRAVSDKIAIMEYWRNRNHSMNFPIKLEKLFNDSLELLSIQPEMGLTFSKSPNIKYKAIRGYRLYYLFDPQTLTLLTIWDTRRNLEKIKL